MLAACLVLPVLNEALPPGSCHAGRLNEVVLLVPPQEQEVAPVIADYWERAAFPHQLVPRLAKLGVAGATLEGWVLLSQWALQCICTSSKWDPVHAAPSAS